MLDQLIVRAWSLVALVMGVVLVWLPAVAGIVEAWHAVRRDVGYEYSGWWKTMKLAATVLRTGERQ